MLEKIIKKHNIKIINFFYFSLFAILIINTAKADNCPVPLKDCSRDHIKFFLYTSVENPPQELMLDFPISVTNAIFNEDADFKFLIHGYAQWKNSPDWMTVREGMILQKMRETVELIPGDFDQKWYRQFPMAQVHCQNVGSTRSWFPKYFKEKKWNLLVVDYNPIARWGCYFHTLKPSVVKIGECIGDLLRLLFREHPKITIDRFHLVGFSFGSQICAQVSNNLKPSGMRIPRITGCDPAFPGFFAIEKKKKSRLNKEHANFVDTIHTNMGEAGVIISHAHYDIYANDGTFQPGCDKSDPGCSHNRALKLFGESINSPVKFIAQKCDSKDAWVNDKECKGDHHLKIEVGEHCEPPKNKEDMGIYQFNTNSFPPFAIATPGQ